ncbi:hypothetical protein [Microseira wollei]|uniref:hypothetical protein n=1 Tax=Microseira wollei TaxID=467598 RepID=UPI001CFE92C1|nr:hypothetical protein [Microseira wollei]
MALPISRYNIREFQYQELKLLWRLALTGGNFPNEEGTIPPTRKLIVWVACLQAANRNGSVPDHAIFARSTWSRLLSTNIAKKLNSIAEIPLIRDFQQWCPLLT